jgi:hypothetical protein
MFDSPRFRTRNRKLGLRRQLQIETLESRQLLSVNPTWEIPIGYPSHVATDVLGNAYVGESDGGPGGEQLIAKYDPSGQQVWLAALTGAGIGSMAVDASGSIYVAGSFSGTVDFDPSPTGTSFLTSDGTDGFIARYQDDGTPYVRTEQS